MFDPRATQIYNTSNEQQQISEALEQLKKNSHINVFFVLTNFLDCPELKNEPEFFKILFQRNVDVVIELIEWMLLPKQIIKKRKIKTNVDSYPYQCRELLKDNWCFYQEFYLALRTKKIQFSYFTKFLRKEFYDKTTIYTALGYFADVMVPFAKYDFSGSYNIMKSLQNLSDGDQNQTMSISRIFNEKLTKQLVEYCHYDPIFQFLKSVILSCLDDSTQVNFGKLLFMMVLKQCQIQNLFIKCPQMDNQQLSQKIDLFENICNFSKQLLQNTQPPADCSYPISLRLLYLLDTIAQSQIIDYCSNELITSRYCGNWLQQNQKMYSSADYQAKDNLLIANTRDQLLNSMGGKQTKTKGNSTGFQSEETQLVQIVAKLLGLLVDIYKVIPKYWKIKRKKSGQMTPVVLSKNLSFSEAISSTSSQKFTSEQTPNSPKKRKKQHKPLTYQIYRQVLFTLHAQIERVFNNLQIIVKYVFQMGSNRLSIQSMSGEIMSPGPTTSMNGISTFNKALPFSSGQNVKIVSMMKYQILRLIYACLQVCLAQHIQPNATSQQIQFKQVSSQQPDFQLKQRESSPNADGQVEELQITQIQLYPLTIKLQKLFLLQIIKKYLTENRWNNIALILVTQISRVLILIGYEYIKKNIERDKTKKFSQSFLAFLIENFNRKDFIFLNTVKFTTQGNLYAIYAVAKDLAYSLNSSNQLVIFLNEFEHWKKFIVNDLKNFQDKLYPNVSKPPADTNEKQENLQIKIDQADSINKLVQNISFTDKWPKKLRRNSISKIFNNNLRTSNFKTNFSAQKISPKTSFDPEPETFTIKQNKSAEEDTKQPQTKKIMKQMSMTPDGKRDSQWNE